MISSSGYCLCRFLCIFQFLIHPGSPVSSHFQKNKTIGGLATLQLPVVAGVGGVWVGVVGGGGGSTGVLPRMYSLPVSSVPGVDSGSTTALIKCLLKMNEMNDI